MRLRTMGFDGFELVGKKVSDYVSDELDVKEVGASYYVKTESSERQSREDALSSFKVNQNDDNFAYVNLVDIEASAGNGALIHSEEIEDRYAFNKRWLKSKGLVNAELSVIKVSGFSMNPTIPDASMILVKLGVPPVEGKIGLILSKGELFIKRLRLVQDKWCGVSDNPDFSLVNIDEESAIIGLAVSLMSDL
jgi:phage repressor protein C with HTH and peptisase S24 domain